MFRQKSVCVQDEVKPAVVVRLMLWSCLDQYQWPGQSMIQCILAVETLGQRLTSWSAAVRPDVVESRVLPWWCRDARRRTSDHCPHHWRLNTATDIQLTTHHEPVTHTYFIHYLLLTLLSTLNIQWTRFYRQKSCVSLYISYTIIATSTCFLVWTKFYR